MIVINNFLNVILKWLKCVLLIDYGLVVDLYVGLCELLVELVWVELYFDEMFVVEDGYVVFEVCYEQCESVELVFVVVLQYLLVN